ncbi:MAG: glycosyltransferase, partial [Acidimicrobiales bacterium]|nr:glycosyltransferase [Acidimicrobiales bacterium]
DDPDARAPGNQDRGAGPPYLLCLGRVDKQKGVHLLVELFAAYKSRHPGPLRLVIAGPVVEPPPSLPGVDVLGPVSDDEKWSLLSGAVALVSPSPWEAFSLAVAEAWSARTPVLVRAGCGATVEHCRRSGGGVPFAGYGEFEALVDRLTTEPDWGRRLGRRGRAYVDARFRWPQIIDRYARFLERVASAGTGARRQGGRLVAPASLAQEMPVPSGRGPARATTGTPSTAAPGRTRQAR